MSNSHTDLTSEEIILEGDMVRIGGEAHRARVNKARAKGLETTTPAGRHMLRIAVATVAKGVSKWVRVAKKRGGRHHSALPAIQDVKPSVAALLACKVILDGISRDRGFTAVAVGIGRRVEDELLFRALATNAPGLFKWGMRKTSRSGYEHRARVLKIMASEADEVQIAAWPKRTALRVGVVLLEIFLTESGIIEEVERRTGHRTHKRIQATTETLEWLEKSHDDHEFLYPFWMPTLDQPMDWVGLYGGGYHTDYLVRRPLVRFQLGRHKKEVLSSDYDRAAHGVNLAQMTPWSINRNVYEVLKHFWSIGVSIGGMPSREDWPIPTRPADIDTNEEARKTWRRKAAKVYERNVATKSARLEVVRTLMIAERFVEKHSFYFPHNLDWRGRIYATPNFLNPQGTDIAHGLLTFAHAKPVGVVGARWLAIHGANCWGEDKLSYDARVAWVEHNALQIQAVAQDPIDCTWWAGADKPWDFLAFCLEWAEYLDIGPGFMSRLNVQADGSNNGLQIYALLGRDPAGALATNVAPSATPQDVYQEVANSTSKTVALDLQSQELFVQGESVAEVRALAGEILHACDDHIPRKCTKRPVMTLPYGATIFSCRDYVRDWLDTLDMPRESTFLHGGYLAPKVWTAIEQVVGPALGIMSWMQRCAEIATDHEVPLRWRSPSGFVVIQEYNRYKTSSIKTVIGDRVRHSNLREDTKKLRRKDQVSGVCPNFVHSLDAACLTEILIRGAAAGITHFSMIHDSYGTHAADAGTLAHVIRGVYADTFTPDLLADWREQIQATLPVGVVLPPQPPPGDLDVNVIRTSPYAFG